MKYVTLLSNSKYNVQQAINRVLEFVSKLPLFFVESSANIAELSAIDDTQIVDGSKSFVLTIRDSFTIDKTDTTSVIDGITVAPTLSGVGRWIRDLKPATSWGHQENWYVNAITGNDENSGGAGEQLKTFAEFRRRVEPNAVYVDMNIQIETDLPATDPVGIATTGSYKSVTITGTRTDVYTGTVSAWTGRTGTNGDLVRDAGWTVSDHIKRFIRFTSGAANGRGAWILQDMGGNDARISIVAQDSFVFFPSSINPAPGDTFVVQTYPQVSIDEGLSYTGGLLVLINLSFGDTYFYTLQQNGTFIAGCSHFGISAYAWTIFNNCCCEYSASEYSHMRVLYGVSGCVYGFGSSCLLRNVVLDQGIFWPGYVALWSTENSHFLIETSHQYIFGDCGASAIRIETNSSVEIVDGYGIRGDITGTTYLASMCPGCALGTNVFTHPVVGATNIRVYPDLIIVPINSGPITIPGTLTRIGTGTEFGVSGPMRAGIKGAINAGTMYALPDYTESASDDLPQVVVSNSVARNLRARLGTAPGGADTVVVTVLVNGAPTALSITFTGAAVTGSDTTDNVIVSPGDTVSFEVVKSGALAANLSLSLEVG